ncbi:MAG: YiiX family permuted papain-like enzyme [Spirochaetes bacterium]|nr:YiiX family permuted papain-like enzyme [Spirochaetota bacterium]MBX3722483.1 YiiX family permuted papain-like enzyme [Turneriella sp.]
MQRLVLLRIAIFLSAAPLWADQVKFRNGDIIFQETRSGQAEAIKRATASPYSHVGIIYFEKGKAFVFEATEPVKATALPAFIAHGVGKKYIVKRLKSAATVLTPDIEKKMRAIAMKHKGKHYDWVFGWSDDKIYCSELVWKIYKDGAGIELAQPKRLGDFNLKDPVVEKKLKERYGKKIPYDEPMVSPGQLFESPLLETVASE